MGFMDKALKIMLKPKVVTDFPGRLTVAISFLDKAPPDMEDVLKAVGKFIGAPEKIRRVEIDTPSAQMSITYEKESVSSAHVLEYLKQVIDIFIRNRNELMSIPTEDIPQLVEKIIPGFQQAVDSELRIDKSFKIEDYL